MLAYATMRLLDVYRAGFLRLIYRFAMRWVPIINNANTPLGGELYNDKGLCFIVSWMTGEEVGGVRAPVSFLQEYMPLIRAVDPNSPVLDAVYWTDNTIHDATFGDSLEAYLMAYSVDDKVTGWEILAVNTLRDPTHDMFQIEPDNHNIFLLNNDVNVTGPITLTPGMVLILGTHRSGKTSLLNRLRFRRVGQDRVTEVLPANITRLVIQEPDAISGSVPLEPVAVFSLIRLVAANSTQTVFVDSLTAIQEKIEGILKTGGINFGVFEYIDSLVQLSYHLPFIVSMSFEQNDLIRFYDKFKGRVPNILFAVSPGRAELFCRGSFPNPNLWDNGLDGADRTYTVTVEANTHGLLTNYNII